jgi:GNAT superfamily N-acetyltransferase
VTVHAGHLPFAVRRGGGDDAGIALGLLDERVAWLVRQGWSGQWGTEPFTTQQRRVASVTRWCAEGEVYVVERDGAPVGVLILGEAHDYVPPAAEPELYVRLLVTASGSHALGAGAALLEQADTAARERGVRTLRVDCYAGNDGRLVRYYQSRGYMPTQTFTVGDWPGQILVRTLAA